MNINEIEAQIDKKFEKTENTTKFERFLAKKYKCIIIFLMSILSISEMMYLILQKNSSTLVTDVVAKYFNVTNKKIE
jgi:glycerol-3-phosphate responsive antiterminator